MSVSARVCGKTPSSRPVRNTIGNSRPFAACIVISVTNDDSGSSVSMSLISAMFDEEVVDRRAGLRVRLELARDADELLEVLDARAAVGRLVGLQLAQVARLFHHRDEQVADARTTAPSRAGR